MQISFFIDVSPSSLNTTQCQHWTARYKDRNRWRELIFEHWMLNKRYVFTKPVKVLYILSFPDRRQRDKDNYIGGMKNITDALKKTFITRDDASWLRNVDVAFIKGPQGLRVLIDEVTEAENRGNVS
ncbi:MAG: hypothetical protein WCI77_07960 [Candidatus Omnitrophota bacterium]